MINLLNFCDSFNKREIHFWNNLGGVFATCWSMTTRNMQFQFFHHESKIDTLFALLNNAWLLYYCCFYDVSMVCAQCVRLCLYSIFAQRHLWRSDTGYVAEFCTWYCSDGLPRALEIFAELVRKVAPPGVYYTILGRRNLYPGQRELGMACPPNRPRYGLSTMAQKAQFSFVFFGVQFCFFRSSVLFFRSSVLCLTVQFWFFDSSLLILCRKCFGHEIKTKNKLNCEKNKTELSLLGHRTTWVFGASWPDETQTKTNRRQWRSYTRRLGHALFTKYFIYQKRM